MWNKYLLPLLIIASLFVTTSAAMGGAWLLVPGQNWGSASTVTQDPTPTPLPEWILIQGLPSDATQADIGGEIYRLVCQDCHGDRGQGLTPQWRSTWAPEDQNCWKSKCHASNHPPEGFIMPTVVPAIAGPGTLAQFNSALDLYQFIKANMPWYAPGSLREDQAWQVTAFLLQMNQVDPAQVHLDAGRAAAISLHSKPLEKLAQATAAPTQAAGIPTQAAPVIPQVPGNSQPGETTQTAPVSYGLVFLVSVVITLIIVLFALRLRE